MSPTQRRRSLNTSGLFCVRPLVYAGKFVCGCVSEEGDHMGWPDSETNYKFVVHPREEIPVIS